MDLFIKIILIPLLFFAPLSFAATLPWACAILMFGICVAFILFIFNKRGPLKITPLLKVVSVIFLFLITLGLAQCAFPVTILDKIPWYPSTLARLYTLEQVSLLFCYFLLTFLAAQVFYRRDNIANFLIPISICGFSVVLCELIFPNGGYIKALTGTSGGWGPFLNRNHAGVFLGMCAISCLTYVIYKAYNFRQEKDPYGKAHFLLTSTLWAFVFMALAAGTVYTRSRGAVLSFLTALFFCSFSYCIILARSKKAMIKGLIITGILLVLVSSLALKNVDNINRFAGRTKTASVDIRYMLYRAAFKMLHEAPVTGIGLGAMPIAITEYMEQPLGSYVEKLHNDWLETLLSIGYAGGAVLLAGLVWFLAVFIRQFRRLNPHKKILYTGLFAALMLMSGASLVDFHFFIPANAFLFFLILGMLCAPTFFKDKITTRYPALAFKIIAALCCALALYIPVKKTMAWRYFSFGAGLNKEARIDYYQKGLSHYPGPRYALRLAIEYYNQSNRANISPAEAQEYRQKANALATAYLQKYPKEKELSRIYLRSRQ